MKKSKITIALIAIISILTLALTTSVQAVYVQFSENGDYEQINITISTANSDNILECPQSYDASQNAMVNEYLISQDATQATIKAQFNTKTGNTGISKTLTSDELANYEITSSNENVATIDITTQTISIKAAGTFSILLDGKVADNVIVLSSTEFEEIKALREISGTVKLGLEGENVKLGTDGIYTVELGSTVNLVEIIDEQTQNLSVRFKNVTYNVLDNNATIDSNGVITVKNTGYVTLSIDYGDYKTKGGFYFIAVNDINDEQVTTPTIPTTTSITVRDENVDTIKNAIENYETINVLWLKDTQISSEVFKALGEEKDKTLNIMTLDGLWTFNSNDITNTNIDVTPALTIDYKPFDNIESTQITDAIFLDFSHSGVLPGKARIEITVDPDIYGTEAKTLYLYYYNPETKSYEFVNEVEYTAESTVVMELDHCSQYAITETKIEESTSNEELNDAKLDDEPNTGEISIITVAMTATIAFVGFIISKKYNK